MDRILVTGGAGFIGSHVVDCLVNTFTNSEIIVLDKLNYAANINFLANHLLSSRIRFIAGDITDYNSMLSATKGVTLILNLAAESHVGRSFSNSIEFTRNNTLGAHVLLEAARQQKVTRIVHVSTDEVYGEVLEGAADEEHPLHPNNPYSGSKAAAEMIIQSYWRSFKAPATIVRANNIFGTRQFPEKIIPRFIFQALEGKPLTIHGDGAHRRHYLAAEDFASALLMIAQNGEVGRAYNIGVKDEYSNLEIATMICSEFGHDLETMITFEADRPFNDRRYSVDSSLIEAMGWFPKRKLETSLPIIARWYRENRKLWGNDDHYSKFE